MSASDHPRPQLVRPSWESLDGPWSYAADREGRWTTPSEVDWSRTIVVPYAPETPASGINDATPCTDHWYQRTITVPADFTGDKRLLLHFQAVDYKAIVFVNGKHVAENEGGYLPFSVDVTDAAQGQREFVVAVHAVDDPFTLSQPRGKQHWGMEPGGIFYERTSGIWQTVWLEVVSPIRIEELVWTPDLDTLEARFTIKLNGGLHGAWLTMTLSVDGKPAGAIQGQFRGNEVVSSVSLAAAGLTAADVAWSPERPVIVDAEIEVRHEGQLVDAASSYFGVRKFEARDNKFFLNNEPIELFLALDQGYWPDTGLTPPNSDALRYDVELAKAMGFNGVRKHMKIEDPRFHYWADHLGLFLWSELPACFVFDHLAIRRTQKLWADSIVRDRNHPCIIVWVPINESWGVPGLNEDVRQRAFVRTLVDTARALDGTRPVISNDGWQSVGGDIHGLHEYEFDADKLAAEFAGPNVPDVCLGRNTIVEPPVDGAPVIVSEWGGLSITGAGDETYRALADADALAAQLQKMFAALRNAPLLSGNCYTQLTDTYQEANGLLFMDRTPKIPLDVIYEMVTGKPAPARDDDGPGPVLASAAAPAKKVGKATKAAAKRTSPRKAAGTAAKATKAGKATKASTRKRRA